MNALRDRRAPYVIAALVVILMALVIWWKNSRATGSVRPLSDSSNGIVELTGENQLGDENAWPRLVDCVERFMTIHNRATTEPHHGLGVDEPRYQRVAPIGIFTEELEIGDARERATLEEIDAAEIWKALEHVVSLRRSVRTQPTSGPLMIHDAEYARTLGTMRTLAQARLATQRLALASGDWDVVLRSAEDILGIARLMALQGADNVAAAVSGSIVQLQLNDLQIAITERELPTAVASTLLELLNEPNLLMTVERMLLGERIRLLDLMSYLYTDDGRGHGFQLASAEAMIESIQRNIEPPVSSDEEPDVDRSAPTRLEAQAMLESMLEWLELQESDPEAAADAEDAWNDALPEDSIPELLLRAPSGSLQTRISNRVITKSFLNATRLMLAIELHQLETGTVPESLDALTPKYLDAIPTDPIHSGPYGYRLLEDDPLGRDYLLYSFGVDATDDDGKTPRAMDDWWYALQSLRGGKGYDYVFTITRHHPAFAAEE